MGENRMQECIVFPYGAKCDWDNSYMRRIICIFQSQINKNRTKIKIRE